MVGSCGYRSVRHLGPAHRKTHNTFAQCPTLEPGNHVENIPTVRLEGVMTFHDVANHVWS